MRPAVETTPNQGQTQARGPAARAAVWTLAISATVAMCTIGFALFPTPEEPFTETLPALSATRAESWMLAGSVAFLIAIAYLVLYLCFRLLGRSRDRG